MIDAAALDIFLGKTRVGTIARLDGDASIFTFDEVYLADQDRPTLSLAYKDANGEIIAETRSYRTKIEPFFSNLLPEGTLRDYLARRAGVKAMREYHLLAQLGHDLPGAVRAVAVDAEETEADELDEEAAGKQAERALRFSLAGVQLKFSAIKAQGKNGGLTIPVTGSGGDWIVKLPSARHPDVPEAEFAAMKLAAKIGIDVPEIDLVPLDQIDGIPEGITRYGESAFAIRRFDRGEEGPVHTEDFAQVFGVFADDKYENASYRQILSVLAIETDEQSVVELVRRLTYSVLIGNGDMHLKNWSLIYPDRRNALLAPAYDLLSTLAYIPGDDAALKFHSSREWASYTYDELEAIADKARLPAKLITATAKDVVAQFDDAWSNESGHLPFPDDVRSAIERHRKTLAI
ncbi:MULTISPECIES: type II toxin-antitoxin system HipA family toxin [Erythrobacteraceae]|jgi:serine/threonine-protein kinase HipA|uniref:Serine/threonine-protein kinase HipA n=1 Tax=Qipengyuania nanhaisediminis TaxID=604088 RepID=A0A1I5QBQ4_9SPHN|nr:MULTISPECIES: type II toxin-antitoxin system HipA family toxin [Erythrobacteraceae]MEC9067563.1 type II toxin-antitoxin system HipA family toxin [Pseudomonadota bacterium]WBY15421.1 type II toxin-antitoxin system HipA family toxin [Erythrobacteraceae bacterium WH01K]SFP43296.1 serine/threonine-protein kinase HipA [Qipengyuania nanhaisediminis]|tara:strand:- start:697 stop:1911 length:1215 start_codon:yes stop_codon:yes gene_type:complete